MIAESASAAGKGDLSKLSVLLSPSDILHRVDKMNLLPVAEAQTSRFEVTDGNTSTATSTLFFTTSRSSTVVLESSSDFIQRCVELP